MAPKGSYHNISKPRYGLQMAQFGALWFRQLATPPGIYEERVSFETFDDADWQVAARGAKHRHTATLELTAEEGRPKVPDRRAISLSYSLVCIDTINITTRRGCVECSVLIICRFPSLLIILVYIYKRL